MEASASTEIGVDLLLDSREKERERGRGILKKKRNKTRLTKQLEQLFLPFFRKRSLTAKSFTHTHAYIEYLRMGTYKWLNATSVI